MCMTKDYQGAVKCSLTGHLLLTHTSTHESVHQMKFTASMMQCGGRKAEREKNVCLKNVYRSLCNRFYVQVQTLIHLIQINVYEHEGSGRPLL